MAQNKIQIQNGSHGVLENRRIRTKSVNLAVSENGSAIAKFRKNKNLNLQKLNLDPKPI